MIYQDNMRKTLGDYNIEKSSSSDVNNISWSQKKQKNENKTKKENNVKTNLTESGTNIIYKKKEDEESTNKKVFKIENEEDTEKSKETTGKRHENTSSVLGQVKEKSYKRPGR